MSKFYSKNTGGFYISEVNGTNMPPDAVAIDDTTYAALIVAQDAGKVIQPDANGKPVAVDPLSTIDQLRTAKINAINDAAAACASQLTSGYPDFEMQTWPDQKMEALAWNADNAKPTPIIDSMASYRGVDRTSYLTKTVAKVLYFQRASAYLVGTRQGYVDQATAATSKAALNAITPTFTLPAP